MIKIASILALLSTALSFNVLAKEFKFVSYNIDTNIGRLEDGVARESHDAWSINNRIPGITNMLTEIDGDIINIQECRSFINSAGKKVDSLNPMLEYFNSNNYSTVHSQYNPSELSFYFITAFKSDRFEHLDTKISYLTKTPNEPTIHEDLTKRAEDEVKRIKENWKEHNYGEEWERSILAVKLLDKVDNKILYVINIHLGLSETNRLKGSELIIDFLREIKINEPEAKILMSGDFNSFPDRGGPLQIQKLLESDMVIELSEPLYLPDLSTRMPDDSTFIAFPYDFFGPKNQEFIKNGRASALYQILDPVERKQEITNMSRECPKIGGKLDHIFANGFIKIGETVTYLKPTTKPYPLSYDEETIKSYILDVCNDGPAFWSDHQPLVVTVDY